MSAFQSSPLDPFQRGPAPAGDIQALGRQWDDLTRQIDEPPPKDGDERAMRLWDERASRLWKERAKVDAMIAAHSGPPSLTAVIVRLRILAWHMAVEETECANRDGIRTNGLSPDERMLADALLDATRLLG